MSKGSAVAVANVEPMRPLEVIVRGYARAKYPAERATTHLAANIEGADREVVYHRAVGLSDPLTADLNRLLDTGAVTRWSSDQLRVFSYRPQSESGNRPLMYRVGITFNAEFIDFEELSAFLVEWAPHDGVEVGHTEWDLTEANRREHEALLRSAAVGDAIVKAQAFASAAGRGSVEAVRLADPGMLGDNNRPAVARMAMATVGGGGPSLALRPDDIVLEISVDARFVAE
jgi:uncharacterized protein YggE